MEFETLFLKTYNEVHLASENYIKKRLIDSVEIGLAFVKISNELLEEHTNKFTTDKFNYLLPYTDLIYTFEKHKKNYSKNSYENALKRDVKPLFETLELKEYSYEQLIIDLATYYSETNIYRIFRNQHSLYDLIYKSENFSKFEIQEYETEIENTEIFDYFHNLVYPKSEKLLNKDLINLKTEKSKKVNLNIKKQDFELDEQLLILNLCLVDKNSIPLTEKIKLIILIGEINDNSIFIEKPSINNLYHKVNKGVDRKGSIENKLNMIENIIIKIEPFDLGITHQTLKKHKSTLISEQNRAKKIK